jgi:hypothetical protein
VDHLRHARFPWLAGQARPKYISMDGQLSQRLPVIASRREIPPPMRPEIPLGLIEADQAGGLSGVPVCQL